MKNKRKILKGDLAIIGIILFILYVLISNLYFRPIMDKNILSEYFIVEGKIETLGSRTYAESISTIISYKVNNKKMTQELFYSVPCRNSEARDEEKRAELLSFVFPVAVSKESPSYCVPLIRPEDFERVGIEFPDSMRYMYDKYFNCSWWEELNSDD